MALKFSVEDRISTYPGRVVMTPVEGKTNTYDLVRADVPIAEGTPINKALFDSKADTLTSDVTVYVSPSGSDTEGDGGADAPFATIQAAIDALPKYLGGHTVQLEIANGTYEERVKIHGFRAGRIIIGQYTSTLTVRGLEIKNSSVVEVNIRNFIKTAAFNGALLEASDGSVVVVTKGTVIDGGSSSQMGIRCDNGSTLVVGSSNEIEVKNCGNAAVSANRGSTVALERVTGSNNLFGLHAQYGSTIRWKSGTIGSNFGDSATEGSQLISGNGTSTLVNATVV